MRKRSAFTLIELIITVAVAGVAILALVMLFQESLKNMERQRTLQSANLLGEDLMNEIRSKKYTDPQFPANFGAEAGETNGNNRQNFDDVDDYDDWSESPPKTIEGLIITNLSGFTWRGVVANVPATNFNSPPLPDNSTDFKRITVIISNAVLTVSNMSVAGRYD
ncbi:MAG: type II secretion system protein [Kiritimatiellia bacterium]|nr:type II secretion system protein [Kiritimatiellia bacterium]